LGLRDLPGRLARLDLLELPDRRDPKGLLGHKGRPGREAFLRI
jgi:hypothetical protein